MGVGPSRDPGATPLKKTDSFPQEAISCFHDPSNVDSEDLAQILVLAMEPLTLPRSHISLRFLTLLVPSSFSFILFEPTPISFHSYHPADPKSF